MKNKKLYNGYNEEEIFIEPVIFSDSHGKMGTYYFNEDFDKNSICNLINVIESYKMNNYRGLNLYFSSHGGIAEYLFMLSDYMNSIEDDFELNINVYGVVASAGFYLLFMIKDSIAINFLPTSYGMVHYGASLTHTSILYSKEPINQDCALFQNELLKQLNVFFKENIISKLNISETDKEAIYSAKDIYFSCEEMANLLEDFKENVFADSGEALRYKESLVEAKKEIDEEIKIIDKKYLKGGKKNG